MRNCARPLRSTGLYAVGVSFAGALAVAMPALGDEAINALLPPPLLSVEPAVKKLKSAEAAPWTYQVRAGDADRPASAVAISWQVENPFRFFKDPKDTFAHQEAYERLNESERETPVLSVERKLSSQHPIGWAAATHKFTCWSKAKNAHACPTRGDYIDPKSHAVVAKLDGLADNELLRCTWRVAREGGLRLGGQTVTASCSKPVRLDIPFPAGAAVDVEIGGVRVATKHIKVEDLLIVGFGDSFGSGEGNPDVPVKFSRERAADYGDAKENASLGGYPARVGAWRQFGDKAFVNADARWQDRACHRSLYSHQLRAALQLAVENPKRAVTFVGLACSGADVVRGLFRRYKGNEWVPNPPQLSQISAAAQAQCGANRAELKNFPEAFHMKGKVEDLRGLELYKCPAAKSRAIDLVMVSIGGNDIGFARLLANAVLGDKTLLRQLGGWIGSVEGHASASNALKTLDERLKALNRALHTILHIPWPQSDRILFTGYPPMALLGDGSAICPDGRAGMDVAQGFSLSARRARESVWTGDKLHQIMKASAKAHGWSFIEAHRPAFVGRGICAGFTHNAFTVADDLRLPRKVDGTWVPYNPADYRAYAKRSRWFRTPNDAFLTGNFHVAPSLVQKALKLKSLSWFQLILASTYSGAFHPTAEGQAAIADAVVKRAREVLGKYGQGSEPRTGDVFVGR